MTMPIIEFKVLNKEDCQLLHAWLQEPHVREFWDNGLRTIEQTASYYYRENDVNRFIFSINGEPAGYIQSYNVNLHSEYKQFSKENAKTFGVDFFIGNKQLLGRGFAKDIMQKFIELYCYDAVRVIVDPDPKNLKAIRVYQTCGFKKLVNFVIGDELHVIMVYDRFK